ncbi:HSP20-like chaperone [Thozetella sp. PMI_491]|nr:HSP20-like chaperone [Thozetella sp. PMI_491]
MAFFTRNLWAQEPARIPLFHFLDDFESYPQQSSDRRSRRSPFQPFQPKFDISQDEDAYDLFGELPGVSKDNIEIDFTGPRTLRIRGQAGRPYASGSAPSNLSSAAQPPNATVEMGQDTEKFNQRQRQPTVEDDLEDVTVEAAASASPANGSAAATPATKEVETGAKLAGNAKSRITEANIGQFSQTFNFPYLIEQDAVIANLQDGLLTIHLPKTPKEQFRRHVQVLKQ